MIQDLFLKKKSAKDRLWDWFRERKQALSHEIIDWGRKPPYCNHPLRRLRELKAEGKARKMAEQKKISHYGKTRESAYELINWFNLSDIGR